MNANPDRKKISIHIGEYYASREPAVIHTVLGSCVAACLFDPYTQTGGMNHILLPGRASLKKYDDSARYGVNAMELLINSMMKLGANRRYFQAKVFGGGHMMSGISKENGVGEKISSFVLEFLDRENIEVVSRDVGGTDSRKIFFYTDTGEVFLKRIESTYRQRIAENEALEAGKVARKARKPGEITFFND
ncbi:MAG: chemotaxis protein CheD [Desulfonatronovibrio sp.]